MSLINKETLKYLANLAKIKIPEKDEEKLQKNLEEILNYFEQLKKLDTSMIEPMTGGTFQKNIFRDDQADVRKEINATSEDIIEAFPEKQGNFLKVPPVFE